MRRSLIASLVFHAAILVAALVVLPNPDAFKIDPQPAIQVDISNISDTTKLMNMTKAEEPPKEPPVIAKSDVVAPTPPAPKVAEKEVKAVREASAEPPPEPSKDTPKPDKPKDAAPPPDPNLLKDLIKSTVTDTPDPKKSDTPKVVEKPKDKPKKPEKKQPKLDPDQIAAFLNKVDESKAPAPASDQTAKPVAGIANLQGTDSELSATIIQALVQRVRECWNVPAGAREANVIVKVHFGLNTDGTVIGTPEVMNPSADPLFDATARSAVAAVIDCQAYNFLPQDKYDLWKDLIINFNPNMMFDS
jgi:outer membrane biosynthesis protein TonB